MTQSLRLALMASLLFVCRAETVSSAAGDAAAEANVKSGDHGALLVTEPPALVALERRGFSFGAELRADGERASDLVASAEYRSLLATIDADLAELGGRSGVSDTLAGPNHPFRAEWLRSPDARFELVAVVNRADMQFADPGTCGEVRLIYRLALQREGRPATRLPMTVNLLFPQPPPAGGDCATAAQRWQTLPSAGHARVAALATILSTLPRYDRVEIDLQNLHGPSLRKDEDDHAEYVLRAFDVVPPGAP